MSSRRGVSGQRRLGAVWLKLAAGVVVIAGVGGGGYALLSDPTSESAGSRTSEVVAASVMDFEITIKATGDLRAKNQLEIRSELESRSTITEIIEEGSTVKEGDLLVRLNADEFQAEVDEESLRVETARNELIAAESNYEIQLSENESRYRKAELAVQLADLSLKQFKQGDAEKTVTQLRQDIESAHLNLARLEKNHANNIELAKRGFISSDDFERSAIELAEQRARVKIAELELEIFQEYQYPRDLETKQSDLEEAKADLSRVERENEIQLASKEAARVNARRQLNMREQRLQRELRQLEACEIRAPTNGLVVYGTSVRRDWRDDEGSLQIGTETYPNQLLIVLPDTSEMMAQVRVPESVAGRVQKGQAVRVKVDALTDQTFTGVVESKGVLAESGGWRDPNSREYTVMVALDSASSGDLKPSMRCEAEILLGRVDDALSIPLPAVFREGPVQYAYVPAANGKYLRRPISVGRRSDAYAEVTTGLRAGDMVLVRDPRPNEILQRDWDPAELAAVGLTVGEDGQPRRAGGRQGGSWGQGEAAEGPMGDAGDKPGKPAGKPEAKQDEKTVADAAQGDDGNDEATVEVAPTTEEAPATDTE